MKKTVMILATLLMASGHMAAQVVQENEAVVVYYMPKTELAITLNYDVVTETPGVFYQYAQRYLGVTEVVTETNTIYSLTGISTQVRSCADMDRAYQVSAQKGFSTQLLALSEDGRLIGYNISPISSSSPVSSVTSVNSVSSISEPMPLLEEQFIAGTTAKMAEGAAKQIYRIREMRLNLLAGEVEHVPADGTAMQLVLEELDNREKALVALFIGTRNVDHKTHTISYTPQKNVNKVVVGRFSQHSGVVKSDDLSGSPIYLSLDATKPSMRQTESTNSKAPALSQVYYNLPAQAQIVIEYNGKEMDTAIYPIAQMGVAIPLAFDLFTGKDAPTIHFNPETGNIQSIQE